MAYLSKEQYEYRERSAAKRNAHNEQIAVENGMTEQQARSISRLCSIRHELHTNMDRIARSDEYGIKREIININAEIKENGLTPMSFISCCIEDYIDIDTIEELIEIGEDVPDTGSQEWNEWYYEEYTRIYSELEKLNNDIEKYLTSIDVKYNTSFCPTGALRVF